jgi:hypothetical protein
VTAPTPPYAEFRLNLEQQRKRAKDLLKAARQHDAAALERLRRAGCRDTGEPALLKLAAAQHCIARELRLPSWAALKEHIEALARTREALATRSSSPDAELRTLHIRCGHDIERELEEAGFRGAFRPYLNPYLQGPVTSTPDWLERRARFIAESFGPYMGLAHADVLAGCQAEEAELARARHDYERVVLWLEHDRYDQFVLLRCLAAFAEHGVPRALELVGPNDFPGSTRFVGLGQLPPEALRLLWERRRPLGPEHVAFGAATWQAFRAEDPRPLAALVRAGTPLLGDLAAALHRHLAELPAVDNGLGLTEQLLLRALAESGVMRVGRLVGLVMHGFDPLPGLGDTGYDLALRALEHVAEPLVERRGGAPPAEWGRDEILITPRGRAVLEGACDWLGLQPAERWVGGVRVAHDSPGWRWDEARRDVVQR